MNEIISSRQFQILDLLLTVKAGLSIDDIAEKLEISRNAVQQHIDKLERDGFVKMGFLNKTAGRPVRLFVLTEDGINSFPKRYASFAELLLAKLQQEMGEEAIQRYMHGMAELMSENLLPQVAGKVYEDRLALLLQVMNEFGFRARMEESDNEPEAIEAYNCIYHDLAQKFPSICELDTSLMASVLNRGIEHLECMSKGDGLCRFKINCGGK